MIKEEKLLAVIPARGGSKRLPKKNILDIAKKPMIAWTIEAAHQSKYIDRIVVSTDDMKTADISVKYGACVPFVRPDELSTDEASSIEVVKHAIDTLCESNDFYEYIILLQPTSPLRTFKHIDSAVDLLVDKNADSIVSVCEVNHPNEWINTLPDDLSMKNFINIDTGKLRSQELSKQYRINGSIYLSKISVLTKQLTFFHDSTYAYVMDTHDSVDIDNKFDYELCNFIANNINKYE